MKWVKECKHMTVTYLPTDRNVGPHTLKDTCIEKGKEKNNCKNVNKIKASNTSIKKIKKTMFKYDERTTLLAMLKCSIDLLFDKNCENDDELYV